MLIYLKLLMTQVKAEILFFVIALFIVAVAMGYQTADVFIPVLKKETEKAEFRARSKRDQEKITGFINPVITYKKENLKSPLLIKMTLRTFFHNLTVTGIVIYGGILFGVIPLFQILGLGYLTGVIIQRGGWHVLFTRTLPHGVLELPLFFVVASFSLSFGINQFRAKKGNGLQVLKTSIRTGTMLFLASIPIVFLAAVLENYGTRLLWGQ
jgi:uncharacterized membrane protein SpoIIM required for sporulation